MKGELKAGGLALVVKSTDNHEVGRVVTLIKLVNPGDKFIAPDGTVCLWVYVVSSWLVSGQVQCNMNSGEIFYGWAVFPPSYLMPIDEADPDAVDENIYFIPIKTILTSD